MRTSPRFGARNVAFGLVILASLLAFAAVILRPITSAKPQSESGTCCMEPSSSSTATTEETPPAAPADSQLTIPDPPGTIDGSKNPELIPDEVAYRVLMIAVAEPEDAAEEQKARARAKMHAAHLNDADLDLFLSTANRFVSQVDAIAARAENVRGTIAVIHPDSIEGHQLSQLAREQDLTLINAIGGLRANLSIVGAEKLQAHVQNIKRKITIYPPPPNMPAF